MHDSNLETNMHIYEMDATALAACVAKGDLSPAELVEASIEACEKLNPTLNAVFSTRFEKAREEARLITETSGALSGIPTLIKDLGTPEAGEPQYFANKVLKEMDIRAPEDSFLVEKLKRAGAVSIGRTTVPELASGNCPGSCETTALGVTRNPWNLSHTAMGSSGGSAAAVASGMVPIAHGNDGGGSIRLPASANGLVGLKSSRGRISWGPMVGESWEGFATQGMLTKTVRDCALTLDLLSGQMPGDPYGCPTPERPFTMEVNADPGRLRIGLCDENGFGPLHQDCRDAVRAVAEMLTDLGHTVEPSWPKPFFEERVIEIWLTVVSVGIAQMVSALEAAIGRTFTEADVEPGTWVDAAHGREISSVDYLNAASALNPFTREMQDWWHGDNGFDLLLSPTMASPPPELGFLISRPEDRSAPFRDTWSFTAQFNMTGQPAISLPLGMSSDGLPIGIQLAARYGDEASLIQIASQLEQAMPWADRKPDTWAGALPNSHGG